MRGYNNGLRRELVGLVGILAGFWVASNIYPKFITPLMKLMDLDQQAAAIVSYLMSLIGVWFAFAAGAFLFMSDISRRAGKVERWLGVVVSVFKFYAVFGAVVYLFSVNPFLKHKFLSDIEKSFFYNIFRDVGSMVLNVQVKQQIQSMKRVKWHPPKQDIFKNAERVFSK
jgi:uncharacterized membrane protein required for colicin V production